MADDDKFQIEINHLLKACVSYILSLFLFFTK